MDELARRVSAGVLKDGPPLRRVSKTHVAEDAATRGAYAFDLCGKRLWVSADGAGERLLVRAGGGSLDLEAWLRRNRFWERARGSGRAARGTRDAEPTEATRG